MERKWLHVVSVDLPRQGVAAGVPPFARLPVLAIAALAAALLVWTSTRYGHGFDEVYFLMAGRDHLDWGYFDQPPLVPALAGALDSLFPGSLPALRLPTALAVAAGIVVTALIARELGGGRGAQAMAAGCYATSGIVVISHLLGTYTIDPLWWTVIAWLVVRWARLNRDGVRDDRPLLWAGIVTAVSLETKFLIPAFWAAIAVSALVLGPRELLRRPLLWAGAAIAVVATVPTLLWQAAHDWPYPHMGDVVAAEFPGYGAFFRDGLLEAGIGVGVLAFVYGLARLVCARHFRPFRFLGVAILLTIAGFVLANGRSYYLMSVFAVPFAVAAVDVSRLRPPSWLRVLAWPAFALSAAITVAGLPIYPASAVADMPPSWGPVTLGSAMAGGELPQQQIGELVAATYDALPPEQKARTVVFAEIYPFASAIEYNGAARGVGTVYSGHRGYWYFGAPPESARDVLFVGFDPGKLGRSFTATTPVIEGLAWLETGRTRPWAEIWPTLKTQ
ncbi:glycosyltransferase family 39 protein [Amycolatopsis minnesotensis]|uniref:Glycosyltransferase family 39 protein n=1 Tax=Amycolatopsis minnesotensis TaxID=337894 RepID=A0ABN2Q3F5_9PSEU